MSFFLKKSTFLSRTVLWLSLVVFYFTILVAFLVPPEAFAQDVNVENDIRIIQLGLKIYYQKNKAYPQNLTDLETYISDLPVDPETGGYYLYQSSEDGQAYELNGVLKTHLEKMKDDQGNDNNKFEVGTNLNLI